MDIGLIASAVGATLAPFTPFLLNISIEGGKKLAEVMAEKGGEAAWNKAQSSWHKIKDRAGDDPKVQGAALMVSAGPEDVSAQAILVRALDACLRKYPDLAQEFADLLGGEPGIHLPWVLAFLSELPNKARLVWKTNAHHSVEARSLLEGLFDVWIADLKFGNPACAGRIAKVPNYLEVVRDNLLWATEQSELIVRHLLLPGHLDCCWTPIAGWLASAMPGVKVSLRSEFWPGWHSARHRELRSALAPTEADRAVQVGRELGLNLIR